MRIQIRPAKEQDYNQVENLMQQVHQMHAEWRPDIYKEVEVVLPKSMYMDHIDRNEILVAVKGNVAENIEINFSLTVWRWMRITEDRESAISYLIMSEQFTKRSITMGWNCR